jgi:formylglycine-generating enzyme required for sulfatase activity
MRYIITFFLCSILSVNAVPAVLNYAGQVAVNGEAFSGNGSFKFAIVSDSGTTTYWSNDGTSLAGSQPTASVNVSVNGGLYSVLLGNPAIQGMNAIDPSTFQQHSDAKLRVWFSDGVNGFQQLTPDRPFTSVPYALSAASAVIAPGSINGSMLSPSLISDLNGSIATGSIDGSMLSPSLLADLNGSVFDGSISTAKMDPNLVRYFIPEISANPAAISIIQGTGTTLSVQASGKYLSYQWQKNGADLVGETGASLDLSNATASADDANYSVVISNDWGSITSPLARVTVATALPAITILGSVSLVHEAATPYTDAGATAVDALGGDLSSAISITSSDINVSDVGNQVVTYSVTDAGGNTNTATRTVMVEDTTDPVLTMLGDLNMTHAKNTAWVDPGATASDSLDGNLSSSITISGTVDVNTTGTYTLSYTVSDAVGNEASLTRTVNIVEGQASTHTADLNASVSLEMIWVDPGTFTMGQSDISSASPEHEVTLTQGFYLGKYEVTQAQYEAVMTGNTNGLSATPSNWPNNPDRPVEMVSWDDIQKFLTRLNSQQADNIPEGWAYVLPTEAQWEYACRAGTTTAYSWGDAITSNEANYAYDGWGTGLQQTADVGQYSANPWGFFDMHGNVYEWTADAWGSYATGAQTDPFNVGTSGSDRVVRGGSWSYGGALLRSASRNDSDPSGRSGNIGFRVGFQQQ